MPCNAAGQSSAYVTAADTHTRVPVAPRLQSVNADQRSMSAKKRRGSGSNLAADVSRPPRPQPSKNKHVPESSRRRSQGPPSLEPIEEDSDFVQDMGRKQPSRSLKSRLTHRSNPSDIVYTIKMLSLGQREEIKKLGWGKFLEFNLQALESRDLYCWLMEHIDPDSMELRLPNGKILPITEQVVNLVLGVPMGRGKLPHHTNAEVTAASSEFRKALGLQDRKITIQRLQEEIGKHRVDGLSMRSFFIIVFSKLLFPSTSSDTSVKDIRLTMDLDKFGEINWCGAVVQDIKEAAHSWQTRKRDSTSPSINGCAPLVIVYYLDNLDHPLNKVDRLMTPRCNFFDKKKIEAITIADKVRRSSVNDHYGLLEMMSQVGSCYQAPLPDDHATSQLPCQSMPSLHVPLLRDLLANDLNHPNARKHKEFSRLVHAVDTEVQAKILVISHAQQEIIDAQYKHAEIIREFLHRDETTSAPTDPPEGDHVSLEANSARGASGQDASNVTPDAGTHHGLIDNDSFRQDCPASENIVVPTTSQTHVTSVVEVQAPGTF
ncbi:unnamed protein product [Urochloa humidicola]